MVSVLLLLLPAHLPAERHLLVLAGQSNMEGTAPYAQAGLPDSIPGVLVWNAFGQRAGAWMPMAHGYSFDTSAFGPEWTLLERLVAKLPGDTFAILKASSGATSLEGHWRSPSSGDTAGPMYLALLGAMDSARRSYPYGDIPFSGFFWMQGESDAVEKASAKAYRERLEAFIVDLRREWSDTSSRWILGQIDVQPAWPWADLVREGTIEVAEALERVSLVETAGLPTDGVHYTADGIKRLGSLFADRWLVDKGYVPSGAIGTAQEIRRINGGRLLITGMGSDPVQEVRLVSLAGRADPWMVVRYPVVLSRSSGRSTGRRGMALVQLRRRSGRTEVLRVAWP